MDVRTELKFLQKIFILLRQYFVLPTSLTVFMRGRYIYLDNAATSFPKPGSVIRETTDFIKHAAGNPGRSGHSLSVLCGEKIYSVREKVASLIGLSCPERVVFTSGATFALNLAIKTSVRVGSHVLISDVEHNSVLRVVHALKIRGIIDYSVFDSDDIENSIGGLIRNETTHIISTLASNVNGALINIYELSRVAENFGLKLILDASQRLGHAPLTLSDVRFEALCCAGHKSLFGFSGVGFAVFGGEEYRESFTEGGSGSDSKNLTMPQSLPERFEAGTLPLPAIISLGAGIDFINRKGLRNIEARLDRYTKELIEIISGMHGIKTCSGHSGIIMFAHKSLSSEIIAKRLDECGIAVRGGFHCAPLAHKKLGTYEDGAVRISLSFLNSEHDIKCFEKALHSII